MPGNSEGLPVLERQMIYISLAGILCEGYAQGRNPGATLIAPNL